MRTLKLLILLLAFSIHANASGYAHNMFVAHKKLKEGKEAHWAKITPALRQITSGKAEITKVSVISEGKAAVQNLAAKMSDMVTLNERIVAEAPYYVFRNEDDKESDDSIITRLVGVVKNMVYSFAASFCR